jgi:hypothetical protein
MLQEQMQWKSKGTRWVPRCLRRLSKMRREENDLSGTAIRIDGSADDTGVAMANEDGIEAEARNTTTEDDGTVMNIETETEVVTEEVGMSGATDGTGVIAETTKTVRDDKGPARTARTTIRSDAGPRLGAGADAV